MCLHRGPPVSTPFYANDTKESEFRYQTFPRLLRNYVYETGSMTGILGQFKWESLKKRRKDNRLILLYKGLKGKARIPTDDLIPKTRRGRNQHSLAFQIPSASKDVYMCSRNIFWQKLILVISLPSSLARFVPLENKSCNAVLF